MNEYFCSWAGRWKIIQTHIVGLAAALGIFSGVTWAAPHAFPVPFIDGKSGTSDITFTDLPASGTIKIFTVSGEEVKRLDFQVSDMGAHPWDITNAQGKKVASGVYFYVIDGGGQQTVGKVVVVR